jgi:peptide/nickel transport system permease protein
MRTLKELVRNSWFSVGAAILVVLAGLVILSFFAPDDPTKWRVAPRDLRPSLDHFLGTDSKGQDVFWQMTYAVRNSLAVALLAAIISRAIAVTVGLVSGFAGGMVDRVLMSINDALLVLPLFLLLVLLAMLLREQMSILSMAVLFGIVGWAWDARLIRSQILSLREREFTYTAILSGNPGRKLVFKEYFPFVLPLLLATLISYMAWVVGMEITLALIGLTDLRIPTLGSVLKWAIDYQAMLLRLWWWVLSPIVAAVALFVGLYLISVSVSEYMDPRARVQRVRSR